MLSARLDHATMNNVLIITLYPISTVINLKYPKKIVMCSFRGNYLLAET